MRLLSRDVETFLDVVLPQYHMIQLAAAGLPALSTPQDNLAAVQKLYPALCKSLKAFEKVTLPSVATLRVPDDHVILKDQAALNSMAQLFSVALVNSDRPGLTWPPPGVEAELSRFYALAVSRPRRRRRRDVTLQQLTNTCQGLRGRACDIAAATLKEGATSDTSSVPPPPAIQGTANQSSIFVSSLIFLATTAGALQFPGAVQAFPSDTLNLLQHVQDMAEIALTTAQHYARELTQSVRLVMEQDAGTSVKFTDLGGFSL